MIQRYTTVYKADHIEVCRFFKFDSEQKDSHPLNFISIVTYDHNQKWGNEDIRLLILFGIAYSERKDFRFVFNHIVNILSSEANINALIRCRSYEDLSETIQAIISGTEKLV
ncbi:MAG: PTS sugar transporter subunit IIA [Erysipelotrichaceae bacterium]|nr:PTS sugar transporter subunit IIA [Erysipelotrichaceae bacterium]